MIYTLRTRDDELPARVIPRREGMDVELDGRTHTVHVSPRAGSTQYIVTVDGTAHAVAVWRSAESVTVDVGPDRFEFAVIRGRPLMRRGEEAAGGPLRRDIPAPMPGMIVSTLVAPGDAVAPGRVVAVMEAMKMQMEIRAQASGRVVAVPARVGVEVARGAVLVTIESTGVGE